MGKIFSPGKLLLTSEYVVLDGALALAVPTQFGQEFFFDEISDGNSLVFWEAYHQEKLWLTITINYKNWEILETNNPNSAEFVLKVLKNIQKLAGEKFQSNHSYHLKTNLQFPADYGLGSSSTLMNNLAEWSEVDAFHLNDISLGGSGYDIAVAKEKSAVLFQIKENQRFTEKIDFNPSFKSELIFIHLNQKQDSREGINHYRNKTKSQELVNSFTEITKQVFNAKNLNEFSDLMTLHEAKLSQFLELETAKDRHFIDCPVFIKSLGAWGGDFVMSRKFDGFQDYFSGKGFSTILPYENLIF